MKDQSKVIHVYINHCLEMHEYQHKLVERNCPFLNIDQSIFRMSPSFNKEVFVDFMSAQIKTLSFLAYIIRVYQEVFGKHSQQMLEGILNMLKLCPPKVTHLRKELLMAARHIWATDLRLSKLGLN